MTHEETWEPPDDLDPQVLRLCQVINAAPGLLTRGSCGGHDGGLRPADAWYVTVELDLAEDRRPTLEAWLSFEFLTWVFSDLGRAGKRVRVDPWARPPYLNHPGRMLYFAIEGERGEDGMEPDEVADHLARLEEDLYVSAEDLGEFYEEE